MTHLAALLLRPGQGPMCAAPSPRRLLVSSARSQLSIIAPVTPGSHSVISKCFQA